MFKLAKDIVSKNSIVSKVFLEKILKLSLCYQVFCFERTFMLMPALNQHFMEKQDSKKNLVEPVGTNDFEIIFTLLVKIIAI